MAGHSSEGGALRGVEEYAWMRMIDVGTTANVLPAVLRAAVNLRVLDILAADEAIAMSAAELVERMRATHRLQLPISNPAAHHALDRLLRLLATRGLLSITHQRHASPQTDGQSAAADGQEAAGGGGGRERKYTLTAMGSAFARREHGRPSLANFPLLCQHKLILTPFHHLETAILEGGCPFSLAFGPDATLSTHMDQHHLAGLAHTATASLSALFMPLFLSTYDGFRHTATLVDVTGGDGACIASIVAKYPHINGINFDLPHVVASAPSCPGVTHVGGDMFINIPHADTILLKRVLHHESDEDCLRILKNCYNSLSIDGKVIVVDMMQELTATKTTLNACISSTLDLLTFAITKGGKERCEHEFMDIATKAGFHGSKIIMRLQEFHILEFYKS